MGRPSSASEPPPAPRNTPQHAPGTPAPARPPYLDPSGVQQRADPERGQRQPGPVAGPQHAAVQQVPQQQEEGVEDGEPGGHREVLAVRHREAEEGEPAERGHRQHREGGPGPGVEEPPAVVLPEAVPPHVPPERDGEGDGAEEVAPEGDAEGGVLQPRGQEHVQGPGGGPAHDPDQEEEPGPQGVCVPVGVGGGGWRSLSASLSPGVRNGVLAMNAVRASARDEYSGGGRIIGGGGGRLGGDLVHGWVGFQGGGTCTVCVCGPGWKKKSRPPPFRAHVTWTVDGRREREREQWSVLID